MRQNGKKLDLWSSLVFVIALVIVNVILILVNDYVHSSHLLYIGNIIAAGIIFPFSLLYVERKEKFNLKRYLYFVCLTSIAVAIVMYLFIPRF